MNAEKPLTVVGLQVERVKRIKAVEIRPPATGVIRIVGKNGVGKSSALDAIVYALAGQRAIPEMPIHTGDTSARIMLDLGRFTATRTWTEKGSYLTVEYAGDGGIVKKPQDFLDALVGSGLGFDLGAFGRLKPAAKAAMLLSLLKLPEDLVVLDGKRKKLYDERTVVNREAKALEARVAAMPEADADVPNEPVSLTALAQEHARLTTIRTSNDAQRTALSQASTEWAAAKAEADHLKRELAAVETRVRALAIHRQKLLDEVAALVEPDLSDVAARMESAEAVNTAVAEKRTRAREISNLTQKQKEAVELTAAIDHIDARKRDMLAAAPLPVPGLGFEQIAGGEYVITYESVPLEQCAQSLVTRLELAIAMALNPTVRVVLIRDASLLDTESRSQIEQMAVAHGFQVWMELVGEGDDESWVIVDGGVASAPTPRPTQGTLDEVEW